MYPSREDDWGRSAGFRHEIEIAQPRSDGQHEAVDRREQRGVVEIARLEIVAPRMPARRAARFEDERGGRRIERRERGAFERCCGSRRNLGPRARRRRRRNAAARAVARVRLFGCIEDPDSANRSSERERIRRGVVETFIRCASPALDDAARMRAVERLRFVRDTSTARGTPRRDEASC